MAAPAWAGLREARAFGPVCAQPGKDPTGRAIVVGSEDCLTLNVYAPRGHSAAALPVMVWIHGGGQMYGSGAGYGYGFGYGSGYVAVSLARLLAAILVGPLLTAWGATVGFFIGAVISRRMLGLTPGSYFGFFFEMLQVPDVLSLLVTGSGFAAAAAMSACRESLRSAPVVPREGPVPLALFCPASIGRAVVYALITMLVMNACWFTLAYQAGAPFGPHMVAKSPTD